MRLPKPQTVRFQTSQRGIRFPNLKAAREDFEAWLETGKSPAGAETRIHIWQHGHERVIREVRDDPKGALLRATIRRALQNGRLQIRKSRTN